VSHASELSIIVYEYLLSRIVVADGGQSSSSSIVVMVVVVAVVVVAAVDYKVLLTSPSRREVSLFCLSFRCSKPWRSPGQHA